MKKTHEQYVAEDLEARALRIEEARMMGFEVVYGDDYHLLLDIDQKELSAEFWGLMSMATDRFGACVEQTWHSKSGNWHVQVSLTEPLSEVHRIALQAALGSDPWKEMMSLDSNRMGMINTVLLFKPGKPKLTITSQG